MPLGFQRLNERRQRPNECINFIKPLASASKEHQAIAQDFLERIAAQCYPVMKRDYISVMSLEEYPANREFLGRNFNAGEVIQLVLKDKAGRWLSFRFVQMVMMHELAHCKQMNHSRFFWQVRNRYADHMKELWSQKYSGEGLWGRGQNLESGRFVHDRAPDASDIPEHLCGGTYRRARGTKRKRDQDVSSKPKLSYAERQQKRIAKKFGVHGDGKGLGEDELLRGAIETYKGGKRSYGKPRVANSKRGRELRANAALARLEMGENGTSEQTPGPQQDEETESEWSEDDEQSNGGSVGFDGKKIKDEHGRELVLVCGGEGQQDEGFVNEMHDLRAMTVGGGSLFGGSSENSDGVNKKQERDHTKADLSTPRTKSSQPRNNQTGSDRSEDLAKPEREKLVTEGEDGDTMKHVAEHDILITADIQPHQDGLVQKPISDSLHAKTVTGGVTVCPVCSLENGTDTPTCIACANVLKPTLMPGHWRCLSEICKDGAYRNAADAGLCGICGQQKQAGKEINRAEDVTSRPMGTTRAEVLRWD